MKALSAILFALILFSSCTTSQHLNGSALDMPMRDTFITQSLFADNASNITEENIQRILDGHYQLPQQLRVAIVRLDEAKSHRHYYWAYEEDEQKVKAQQAYLDLFTEKLMQSSRVIKLMNVPNMLISKSPSFTNIREAAVRMQADVVLVYSVSSHLYSKYKLFSNTDIKAYATTQLIMLDVRTGLIPFSTVVTKEHLSQKKKEDLDNAEAADRTQHEAILLTIGDATQQIAGFLAQNK